MSISEQTLSKPNVVGIQPWLPWPLSASPWWTQPVRAERLAALRIALGAVLLLDVLWSYWPNVDDFFGANSLGGPDVFAGRSIGHWNWSLLRWTTQPFVLHAAILLLAGVAALLMLGLWTRWAAIVAWVLSLSLLNLNYFIHNGGDRVRTITLLYLTLCPCAAVWSLDLWRRRMQRQGLPRQCRPIYVHPWPLRLLFIQMGVIYFFSGVFKLRGEVWHSGEAIHYVMGNLAWTRWSPAQLPAPNLLLQAVTWVTLVWELGFPLLVWLRPTRKITLWLGVGFHVGTGIALDLGFFPLYMLCLYLPLLPWERLGDRRARSLSTHPAAADVTIESSVSESELLPV